MGMDYNYHVKNSRDMKADSIWLNNMVSLFSLIVSNFSD